MVSSCLHIAGLTGRLTCRFRARPGLVAVVLAAGVSAGCSGTGVDPSAPSVIATAGSATGAPAAAPPGADTFVPGTGAAPGFKIGRPYTINGVWYRPAVDWTYVEEGVASWYGSEFHGRATANGERFDMRELSAAHRTLPLPSIVQVTNLENGRSLKLRVNDRGPFARNRIIDVSKSAAKELGFYDQGTARVRVQLVADESMRLAGLAPAATPTPEPVAGPAAARMAATAVAATGGGGERVYAAKSFIQAGAFADGGNASRAGLQLARLAPVVITYGGLDGPSLYRVRLGPLTSADETDRVLAEVIRAGYPASRVVVE